MGTRCTIRVQETWENENGKKKAIKHDIYHHYDGYIEGVGFTLLDMFLNKDSLKLDIKQDIDYVANFIIKDKKGLDNTFEITAYNHIDIEYFYLIDVTTKTIEAWHVNNWKARMKKYKHYTHDEIVKMYLNDRENLK